MLIQNDDQGMLLLSRTCGYCGRRMTYPGVILRTNIAYHLDCATLLGAEILKDLADFTRPLQGPQQSEMDALAAAMSEAARAKHQNLKVDVQNLLENTLWKVDRGPNCSLLL